MISTTSAAIMLLPGKANYLSASQCAAETVQRNQAAVSSDIEQQLKIYSPHRILSVSLINNTLLAAGSDDGKAYLWDLAKGQVLETNTVASSIEMACTSNDGRTTAFVEQQKTSIFSLDKSNNERRMELEVGAGVSAMQISPGGNYMAIGKRNGSLQLWAIGNRTQPITWSAHIGAVRRIAFPDGTFFATAGDDSTVRLWDVNSAAEIRAVKGISRNIDAMAFATDASMLAFSGDDSKIILWDVKTGKIMRRLTGHLGKIRVLCFSPDNSLLVSGGDDSLYVWDTNKKEPVYALDRSDHSRGPYLPPVIAGLGRFDIREIAYGVATFSADGNILVCGGTNNTVVVWDTRTWNYRILKPIQ